MIIALDSVGRTYPGEVPTRALADVSLSVTSGEMVAVIGRSGSGKSTLLNILALLDRPDAGAYLIDGVDVEKLTEDQRSALRSRTFGFVFQSFHLLEARTLLENVELGLTYQGVSLAERHRRAGAALERVGLGALAGKKAVQLSGGERQRVAMARAVVGDPEVVVADEPTGNLDSANADQVMATLASLRDEGRAVVVVTHDARTASWADRVVEIADGRIVRDSGTATAGDAPAGTELHPGDAVGTLGRVDLLRDALANLRSGRRRALAVVVSVALGVGLVLTTLGLSRTASAQVSDRFDARLNRDVTVSWTLDPLSPDPGELDRHLVTLTSPETLAAAADLVAVDAVATLLRGSRIAVDAGAHGLHEVSAYGAVGDLVSAGRLRMSAASVHGTAPEPGSVWLGFRAAENLGIGPLDASPVVAVDGRPFVVSGIIDESPRETDLTAAVVLAAAEAPDHTEIGEISVLIHTMAGGAPQVAAQALAAVDPYAEDGYRVEAPPDPRTLRDQVEGDLALTLAVLAGIAVLTAFVSLTSTMTVSVVERTSEFGLRRAIGARVRDVRALVVTEAAMLGLVGAVAGTYAWFIALLVITLVNGWVPVYNFLWVPLAVVAGIVVGIAGSVVAARRASLIEPSAALRSV